MAGGASGGGCKVEVDEARSRVPSVCSCKSPPSGSSLVGSVNVVLPVVLLEAALRWKRVKLEEEFRPYVVEKVH